MANKYDVVVIGGGTGGYPGAIRAAQHGLSVACIDDWKNYDGSHAFGGTCLNAGCIPSKALLESSELLHRAQHEFGRHGISTGDVGIDIAKMQARKAGIVKQLTGGIGALFKANKVTPIVGRATLKPDNVVDVTHRDGKTETIEAQHVILATGSLPIELPFMPFDGKDIVDSWGALEFDEVPPRIGVIGAGVIGLELGSVWNRLGSDVVVLEALEDFLALADQQIAKEAAREFKKQKLDIRLGAKVTAAKASKKGIELSYEDRSGSQSIVVDKVVVAVGRRPYTEGLMSDDCGVRVDGRGFIVVDDECRTTARNVWACGDCVRGPMLAHKGSEEAVMVADLIAGESTEVNYNVIPSVIYTAPEIAWVGKTEEELKTAGTPYKAGSFSFAASGRAKAMEQASGTVKLLAHADTDEILGVHIIGPMAGELIGEIVLAMEFSASAEDIQRTVHAHPTLSEAVHEAALSADKRALHAINR
ncbi:MAG: dihydrolipoyl dehydrogenase [Pseudomonadota bacterium]